MKLHDVYDEVDASTVNDEHQRSNTYKMGPQKERTRSKIEDEDSVYASTPMFTTLWTLLALQMSRPNWTVRPGRLYSISTRTHRKGPRR